MTELVALYWTVSGPVDVHYGREWSLFEWRDRCQQAAATGFRGIGLWHADVAHQLQTRTLAEMKQIFDDAGLEYLEVEFLTDFFVPPGEPARTESDRLRKQLFETAATFDAHHIKVGNIPGTPCELGRLTDEFAALCADAAQHTEAKVAYEFMPFDVNVDTLDKALALAAGADAPNGGLAIDTWHMGKLGISPADLSGSRRGSSRGSSSRTVSTKTMEDPIDETINHRELPGEGEFDVPGYVAALQEIGYPGPWGVEVLSAELRSLPIEDEFKRAYETTLAQFGAGVA